MVEKKRENQRQHNPKLEFSTFKSQTATGWSRWMKAWVYTCSLTSGFFALLWLMLRSGARPSRFTYPCQQAAFSAAWAAFGIPVASAFITARRRISRGLRSPAGLSAAVICLLVTAGIWGFIARAQNGQGPLLDPPRDYRAQLYHVTHCPQDPVGDRFPGLDTLVNLMGEKGTKFFQSPTVTQVSGPDGIFGADDVVVIKINYQWSQRGGSNTDVLKGVIRWIVDHPDTFNGEIVVCENAQFNSTSGFDRSQNNAQDQSQSPHDVVVHYQNLGHTISHFDWTLIRGTSVNEYSTGDMNNGYVIYPRDDQLNGRISYPKFQTDHNTYISLRDGIWDTGGSAYDREHLKYINLPVLKSHHATYGVTACVKNYMGTVTDQLSTYSHSAIRYGILGAHMGEVRPADLNILDCIWINADPYSGPGTSYSGATRRDELVASQDAVAADLWAAKYILIPAFIENGYSPPWPEPSADPDDPSSDFRQYLDNSMNYILAAGFDATNNLSQMDVYTRSSEENMNKVVTGPGPAFSNAPLVRVFPASESAVHEYEFNAYGASNFGVNVTAGDVDGNDLDEIVTGPGPGNIYAPHIRGFSMIGTPLNGFNFMAYGTSKFGANAAAGDLDNDGREEIITGPGPGAVFGPHVRAFSYDGSSVSPVPGVNFFAYGTRKWGVNVTGGDIDGDGFHEIVTGAGPGAVFGPHVRGWNVDGGTAVPNPEVSYFAYGTRKFGVRAALGDADGDGFAEIVTAPGPSVLFGAHIRGWNYDNDDLTALSGFSFFAWPSAEVRYGARIFAGADLDENNRDEILAGAGPDPSVGSPVQVFRYNGSQVTSWFSLQAYPSGWTQGATVAAGNF